MRHKNVAYFIIFLLVAVGLMLYPFVTGTYFTRLGTFALMYVALASAWNLLGGYMGYASFGNVAFFGIGAYAAGVMMSLYGRSILEGLAVGVLIAVALAVIISPVLRLKGHYFAIATLAVAEATREIVANMAICGGATGLAFPIRSGGVEANSHYFYFSMLAVACVTVGSSYLLRRSRLGFAVLAIKADEATAESLGVNVERYKRIPLLMSACFTALAGGLYGYWITFIDPASSFHVSISVTMIVMVLLGGAGTVLGPVVGAILLEILSELTWSQFLELHNAVLGGIIILLVLVLPRGIVELVTRQFSWSDLRKEMKRYSI